MTTMEASTTDQATTTDSLYITSTVEVGLCYYYTFDCPGYSYGGQCYSNKSSLLSCPSCNNIGGTFIANYGCYYEESSECGYLSAGGQCHTHRCREQLLNKLISLLHFNAHIHENINKSLATQICTEVSAIFYTIVVGDQLTYRSQMGFLIDKFTCTKCYILKIVVSGYYLPVIRNNLK